MPDSPTTCPVCNTRHVFSGCLHALADRLAAVEARLPVVAPGPTCKAWCGKTYQDKGVPPLCMHQVFQVGVGSPLEPIYCTKACLAAGRPLNPAPPPSAEPTTVPAPDYVHVPPGPTFRLTADDAAKLFGQPAPVASGASVPDGWKLGEGWRLVSDDDAPRACWGSPACFRVGLVVMDKYPVTARCMEHAKEALGLVPVEPPKAETAQAAEPSHSEDCDVRAGRSRNCSCGGRDAAAEPTPMATATTTANTATLPTPSNVSFVATLNVPVSDDWIHLDAGERSLLQLVIRVLLRVDPPKAAMRTAAEALLKKLEPTARQQEEGLARLREYVARKRETAQPAEPSAPVGFRVIGRSGPGVPDTDGMWVRFTRRLDGSPALPGWRPERLPNGILPSEWNGGCFDILDPIAEPAAPPHPESNQTYPRVDRKVFHGKSCHHEVCQPAAPPVADDGGARSRRFNDTTGALSGGNSHPDRCVCQRAETGRYADTPHKHRDEPPFACARCKCKAYRPEAPPVAAKLSERLTERGHLLCAEEVRALETALDAAKAENEALRKQLATGPIGLDGYESGNLRAALLVLRQLHLDTGDWMGQVLNRLPESSVSPNKSIDDQLAAVARELPHAQAEAKRNHDEALRLERIERDLREQLATRDARIADLEASHREDVERAVREERERCSDWGRVAQDWKHWQLAIDNGPPVPKVGG